MTQNPLYSTELFTLTGVIQSFTWVGFSARRVVVQNLDATNTYTVTIAGHNTSLSPQQQLEMDLGEAGLDGLDVTGTGQVQVIASPVNVQIAVTPLVGLSPQNAGDFNISKSVLTGLTAGVALAAVPVLFNSSATKSLEILAVRLNPRFQATAIAAATLATFDIEKTGAVNLVTVKSFNDVAGGAGTDPYPGYITDVGTFDFTLSAVAGALVLAPGNQVLATVTQGAAADVTTCELEIHWRVLT